MPPKARPLSLDIPETQVAVDFFDDDEFQWHMRILIVNCTAGRWIWATPDLEVQHADLGGHRVVPVPRAAPYPARLAGQLYAFDPLQPGQMEQLRAEAAALAQVLGVAAPAAPGTTPAPRWVVSDPAHPQFGQAIDASLPANEEKFIKRDATGMAKLLEGTNESWVSCENVAQADHQRWLEEKYSGPGRDYRVCPIRRTGVKGPRRQSVDQMLEAHRSHAAEDWPFRGPSACLEVFQGVLASGMGFQAYINHYINVSGLAANGALAHELRTLFNALRHLGEYDQTDAPNLAGAELLARRVIQIQRAVKRSAKHPDFTGLDSIMASNLDETGGIVTSKFDEWVAGEQKTQAMIMKNVRQFVEERNAEDKRGGEAPAGGKKKT